MKTRIKFDDIQASLSAGGALNLFSAMSNIPNRKQREQELTVATSRGRRRPSVFADLPLNPTPRMLRQFSVAWFVFLLALATRAWLRKHPLAAEILAAISLAGVIGWFLPAWIRWLFVGATVIAFPIGWVVTQVVLAIMFYVVLTPIALIFRWRGRDELRLRPKADETTFWVTRGTPPEAKRYLKQY